MNKGQLNVYRGCKPVVDAKYGPQGDGSVTEVLLEALAEAAEVDPTDLPPLYEHVDLDALDNLFEEQAATSNADTLLSFRVETWNVFVRGDGHIRVCDNTQPTAPEPVFESTPA